MHKHGKTIRRKEAIIWVNIVFMGMASLLLFYYVMMANSISAKNYSVQTLRDKVESLSELNSSYMSKKLSLENPTALMAFAQTNNLVEAKNIVYIFENKDVARR